MSGLECISSELTWALVSFLGFLSVAGVSSFCGPTFRGLDFDADLVVNFGKSLVFSLSLWSDKIWSGVDCLLLVGIMECY